MTRPSLSPQQVQRQRTDAGRRGHLDGAAVYLNGAEVARSHLPTGTLTSSTLAITAIAGADESAYNTFAINPGALTTGTNVLAVEIHQANATSSDISFDLDLIAQ